VFVQAQSPISHTHSCTHAIERTYVQSIACVLSPHVTLLGHPFPLFPFIFTAGHTDFPHLFSQLHRTQATQASFHRHPPTPITTISSPPCHRQPSYHSHFHFFLPIFSQPRKRPKLYFCSDFCQLHAQTVNTKCACIVCIGFL
jgi:hypothetical protein